MVNSQICVLACVGLQKHVCFVVWFQAVFISRVCLVVDSTWSLCCLFIFASVELYKNKMELVHRSLDSRFVDFTLHTPYCDGYTV